MSDANLFKMLTAHRPGTPSTPFDTYCTQALAYFLLRGEEHLLARLAVALGESSVAVAAAEPQGIVEGAVADLVLTLGDGRRLAVEVQTEAAAPTDHLEALEAALDESEEIGRLLVGMDERALRPGWPLLTWPTISGAMDRSDEPLAPEFADFIRRDILGAGPVTLREALSTNRFFALAGAVIRRRFGARARYTSTASQPMGDRYRYLGTSFALDGGANSHWIGLVNETIPLGEHYDLMLASKERTLEVPGERPRTTADWRWPNWTTGGRVAGPIELDHLVALLDRFPD